MRLPALLFSSLLLLGCDSDYPYTLAATADGGSHTDAGPDTSVMMTEDDASLPDASLPADMCWDVIAHDDNADGTIDSRARTSVTDDGQKTTTITDVDEDGSGTYVGRSTEVHWNETDELLESSVTNLVSNITSFSVRTTYDEQGRPAARRADGDYDGNPSLITAWSYHANGELSEKKIEHDGNDDGVIDGYELDQFDDMGRPTLHEEEYWNPNIDKNGSDRDEWNTYEYASMLRKASHYNAEVGLRSYSEHEYDEQGRVVRESYSLDGNFLFDAPEDWEIRYVYQSNIVLEQYDGMTLTGEPNAPDGEWDFEIKRVFSESNLLVEESAKTAVGESLFRRLFEYDEEGRLTRQQNDDDGDGDFDYQSITEYDDEGRVTKTQTDNDGDGVFEVVETQTYSPYGDPAVRETYRNGELDSRTAFDYEYAENGFLIKVRFDYDGDGEYEAGEVHERDTYGRPTRIEIQMPLGTAVTVLFYEYSCPPE